MYICVVTVVHVRTVPSYVRVLYTDKNDVKFQNQQSCQGCQGFSERIKNIRLLSLFWSTTTIMSDAPTVANAGDLINLDTLQSELDSARGQVNIWAAQRELALKEAVATHKTAMAAAESTYVELLEKGEDLAYVAEELARRKEWEQAELDALREETLLSCELGVGLPRQLQTLRERVQTERSELEKKVRALQTEELDSTQQLDAHQNAVELYRCRLGLRFEVGSDEELKFFFSHIDPGDRKREFFVAVRALDGVGFEMIDCDPEICITNLLEECNTSDNLSIFVRGVRKAFRALVAPV